MKTKRHLFRFILLAVVGAFVVVSATSTVAIAAAAAAAAEAAEWKFQITPVYSHSTAPALVRPFTAPGFPGGWVVIVTSTPDEASTADAAEIVLRYETGDGKRFSRTQTAEFQVDGNGRRLLASVFFVGDGTKVLSVSARAIRWVSVEEVER